MERAHGGERVQDRDPRRLAARLDGLFRADPPGVDDRAVAQRELAGGEDQAAAAHGGAVGSDRGRRPRQPGAQLAQPLLHAHVRPLSPRSRAPRAPASGSIRARAPPASAAAAYPAIARRLSRSSQPKRNGRHSS